MINLHKSVQEAFKLYSLDQETFGLTKNIYAEYAALLAKCQSAEDKKILARLFKNVNYHFINYLSPKPADLSINEMVRLAEIGIKIGSTEMIQILPNPTGKFNVYQLLDDQGTKKLEIFEQHWDNRYPCSLNPKDYPVLFNSRKKLVDQIKSKYGDLTQEQVARQTRTLKNAIEEICHKAIWGFKVPKETELPNPISIEMKYSAFITEKEKSLFSQQNKKDHSLLQAQSKKIIPSLFIDPPSSKLSTKKFQILFLVNSGTTTKEGDLYKLLHYSLMRLKMYLKKRLAESEIDFLLYQDSPGEIIKDITKFTPPKSKADMLPAFKEALEILGKAGTSPVLIHITDTNIQPPDELGEVLLELASKKIPFHQILVGHDTKDCAEYIYNRTLCGLGQKTEESQLSQRINNLSSITRELGGSQTNCVASYRIAEAMLSALDLSLASYFVDVLEAQKKRTQEEMETQNQIAKSSLNESLNKKEKTSLIKKLIPKKKNSKNNSVVHLNPE
ncbi:MAG: hypothetical protein OEY59_08740 [Deltaproteobacteria bacterium]|nr:hypothetical protein [Deltaproteobacteria bacterium]